MPEQLNASENQPKHLELAIRSFVDQRHNGGPSSSSEERKILLTEQTKVQAALEVYLGKAGVQGEATVEQLWTRLEHEWLRANDSVGIITPPSFERFRQSTEEQLEMGTKIGTLLAGPPGVGKSILATSIAEHLREDGQRIIQMNADPVSPSTEGIGKHLVTSRPVPSESILSALAELKKLPDAAQASQISTMLVRYVQEETQGLPAHEQFDAATVMLSDMGVERSILENFYATHTLTVDSLSQVIALVPRDMLQKQIAVLENHFRALKVDEIGRGYEHFLPGELLIAAERGDIVLIHEVDKMAQLIGAWGEGLEELLNADNLGKTINIAGRNITIHEKFRVIITANYPERLPQHIRRRFLDVHIDTSIADLVFQARLLTSDESGQSLLPQEDEEQLALFLTTQWSALGRRRDIAFNTNALVQLCNLMTKRNHSFHEALNIVLKTSSNGEQIYAMLQETVKPIREVSDFDEPVKTDREYVSLAQLNWRMNRRNLGGKQGLGRASSKESKEKESEFSDKLDVELQYGNSLLVTTNGQPVVEITLDNKQIPQGDSISVAELSESGVVIISTTNGKKLFIDSTTGETLRASTYVRTTNGEIVTIPATDLPGEIHSIASIGENGLVVITRDGDDSYSVTQMKKTLTLKSQGAPEYTPTLIVEKTTKLSDVQSIQSHRGITVVKSDNGSGKIFYHQIGNIVTPVVEQSISKLVSIHTGILGLTVTTGTGSTFLCQNQS